MRFSIQLNVQRFREESNFELLRSLIDLIQEIKREMCKIDFKKPAKICDASTSGSSDWLRLFQVQYHEEARRIFEPKNGDKISMIQ